jgi:hypothetical protein
MESSILADFNTLAAFLPPPEKSIKKKERERERTEREKKRKEEWRGHILRNFQI